jgi:hypothetical protein
MEHLKTYRAGEPGYIATRTRGTLDIWHDQKRYVYRTTTARAARQFIRHAWQWENIRIAGAYPSYTLETRQ